MIRITFSNSNLQEEVASACPPTAQQEKCHLILFKGVDPILAQKVIQYTSVELEELKSRSIEIGASCIVEGELVFPLYSDWLNLLYYKMYYQVHEKMSQKWMPRIVACKVEHEWIQGHCLNVKDLRVKCVDHVKDLRVECVDHVN